MKILTTEIFVTLASSQTALLTDFYKLLTDTEPTVSSSRYAEFQLHRLRLAIFTPKGDNAAEFAAPNSGAMSLCLEVDDLDAAIARLTHLGYPPSGDIMHAAHGKEIYAYDPDGNRLILHQAAA